MEFVSILALYTVKVGFKFISISDPQWVGQYQLLQGKTGDCSQWNNAGEHEENYHVFSMSYYFLQGCYLFAVKKC